MQNYRMNRRQALLAAGMGTAALGMPGAVMGTDQRDDSGTPVHSEKSCILFSCVVDLAMLIPGT